jgi:hypothetical protein
MSAREIMADNTRYSESFSTWRLFFLKKLVARGNELVELPAVPSAAVAASCSGSADGAFCPAWFFTARRDEFVVPKCGGVLAGVARGPEGANSAVFPTWLGPACREGFAPPVRGLIIAGFACRSKGARRTVLPLGLRPTRRKGLFVPVACFVLAQLASAPQSTNGSIRPLRAAAPRAARLSGLVAAILASINHVALLAIGQAFSKPTGLLKLTLPCSTKLSFLAAILLPRLRLGQKKRCGSNEDCEHLASRKLHDCFRDYFGCSTSVVL